MYAVRSAGMDELMAFGKTEDQRHEEAAELLSRLESELAGKSTEALQQIAQTCRRALRVSRRARPVPQASFEAALLLVCALADGALADR